ncbi:MULTISPECIES: type I restriction endonuclease subunit R [unclassified Granulicatella]|uniref:type I restriction endonuclease subunit R n=1 Tax=unclassified Granulicatella TaxID=2630493 RepID=UPI00066EA3C0|nr:MULTISPECIES: HsdR family type I site-specific deoxyribonuclease [unclassified Granulicatella]
MSNAPKTASEKTYQENFVRELEKYRWKAPDFLDGNKQKVTVQTLIDNWRNELNRINADQLEGVALTDSEFNQVMSKVNQISNSYEAAKLLAMEEGKGKIDGIYRESLPGVTRKQITLSIFKKAAVSGGDSSYQVAREIVAPSGNRFDIVLLINGLPLINIEQKRTDKTIAEAFGQLNRYYRDGEYSNNFMAFSQMMIITTEIETCYFATPKSVNDFNPSFMFHWSDKNNHLINDWKRVISLFLRIPMAHQMVGDYLVIDEAKDKENRRHMLMRPYQIYALQAIESAAFGADNEDKIPHGGFVWHTTGSGKTITSFKTALFLSTRAGFDKVIFLVDRRELDSRTGENFKAYAAYEPVDVDDTSSTYQLKKKLKMVKNGIIVTTTFKLNNLIEELKRNQDYSLSEKKFVFIIDEAHRTTMGQMMGTIKDYFKKNGLFFGFTGTPLFDENKVKGKINEKSELINTTEKLFGPELHQYTIDQAISDRNVLGFHIDYINTGEFKSYEDLKEKLLEKILNDDPSLDKKKVERQIAALSDLEVEKEAVKNALLIYQDETHIPRVVQEILDNWDTQSQNKEFNAILTVAYKKRVIDYYKEFKKQLAERGDVLNIAMTFSFGNENDPENIAVKEAAMMFKDYSEFTGIEFIAGDKKHGEQAYFEDVVERATRGGSGRNPKNIDLVIVADQLLTGYDSKRLNTLYVDRKLELQSLIQAYSRTNRVFGASKEFGTIINFQYPKITEESVNEALKLYGSGGKSSKVIVDQYDIAVSKLKKLLSEMVLTLPEPSEWASIKDCEEEKQLFKEAFLKASEQMNIVQQYYEYQWSDDGFGMTEHTWLKYIGAYKNLFSKDPKNVDPPIIRTLQGRTKLANTQVIDAGHILNLIGNKVITTGKVQTVDAEFLRLIYEKIQQLSDNGEAETAALIREFVEKELITGHIPSDIDFDVAFKNWKKEKLKLEVKQFSEFWGITNSEILIKSVNSYSENKNDNIPYIDEIIESIDMDIAQNKENNNRIKHSIDLGKKLPSWIQEVRSKFS